MFSIAGAQLGLFSNRVIIAVFSQNICICFILLTESKGCLKAAFARCMLLLKNILFCEILLGEEE